MSCGIYKFENLINHKKYIGQSIDLETRYYKHKYHYEKKDLNKRLYQAFWKYGWDNFSYEIIEYCSPEELDEKEIHYIQFYDSYNHGYNATKGGQGGANHPSKPVQQYDLQGNFIKEFPSAILAAKKTGISYNILVKCCQGKAKHCGLYQWKYSNDKSNTIQQLSNKEITLNERKILQYDLNKNLLNVYESMDEASKKTGITKSTICSVCKGKKNTAGNFVWRYFDDPLTNEDKIITKEKSVLQFDKSGNFIKEFPSITIASKETGIYLKAIGLNCRENRKSAGGYVWKYK